MSDGVWSPERRLLTAGLVALITASAFEGMAVPTVLPALVDELGGLDLYGWAFSAFWLTNIVGITLSGLLSDRRGPAMPLVAGSLLLAFGMVVGGLAGSMPWVIAGRAIQGFGSGAVGAVVYAVIARAYSAEARPRMIALISSAWVVPGLVGPALAGLVTDTIGWRWVFLGVVPPVLLTAALMARPLSAMPAARTAAPARSDARRLVDAMRLAAGSTLLLAAIAFDSILPALALGALGLWLALGAIVHLVPAGTLRALPGRPAVIATIFVVGFSFFGTESFVPLTIAEIRGGSVTLGGLALSAAAVTWAIGSWLQARAASAGLRRVVVTSGTALIAAGIVVTSGVLLPEAPIAIAAVGWAIGGLGMGLAYSMLSLLVLETATPGEEGFSSAALALMFTLGTAFGAGIGGSVVALADRGVIELVVAIAIINAIMLGAGLVALALSLRVPRGRGSVAVEADVPAAGLPLEHP